MRVYIRMVTYGLPDVSIHINTREWEVEVGGNDDSYISAIDSVSQDNVNEARLLLTHTGTVLNLMPFTSNKLPRHDF